MGLAMLVAHVGGLGQRRQGLDDGSIHRSQHLRNMPLTNVAPGGKLGEQLADDSSQALRIEHIGRFRERTERSSPDA